MPIAKAHRRATTTTTKKYANRKRQKKINKFIIIVIFFVRCIFQCLPLFSMQISHRTFTMNCVSLSHMNFIEKKERNTLYHSVLGRISFSLDKNRSLRLRRLHANEYTNKCDRTEGQKRNLWNKKYDWEKFACKYIDACVCALKDEIHFERRKRCHQMEYKHIFTIQSVGHHSGHFCWRTMWWWYKSISIQKKRGRRRWQRDNGDSQISHNILLAFIPSNHSTHLWNFRSFWMRKILLSNGFYLHQMKDTKIDFTTDSSRRRIKDGTFIWRTPFVLLIIAKTMQTNK